MDLFCDRAKWKKLTVWPTVGSNRCGHTWAPCCHNWSCVILDWSEGPFFWHFKTVNACFFSKVYTTMKFQLVCRKFQLVCTPIPERCDWYVQTHWYEGAHVWAWVQGFYPEAIIFKSAFNMFERMEIAEYIYKDVVEPCYNNILRQIPTVLVTAGKWEEKPPLQLSTPRWVKVLAST